MPKDMSFPADATHELHNITTQEVSLVDMPANKRPFLVVKSADASDGDVLRTGLVSTAKKLAALLGGDNVDAKSAQELGKELLAVGGVELAEAPAAEVPAEETVKAENLEADAKVLLAVDGVEAARKVIDDATKALKRLKSDTNPAPGSTERAEMLADLASICQVNPALQSYLETMQAKYGDDPPAEADKAPEDEPDPFEAILEDATKVDPPDAFDWAIQDAQLSDLHAELADARQTAEVDKAEIEGKLAFAIIENEQALQEAADSVEKSKADAAKAIEDLAKATEVVTAKDAEIAALKTKLQESASALAKAEKLTKAAPQALKAAELIARMAKGDKAAGSNQAITEGESATNVDPWETGWEFE